jgi:hypothetical protein
VRLFARLAGPNSDARQESYINRTRTRVSSWLYIILLAPQHETTVHEKSSAAIHDDPKILSKVWTVDKSRITTHKSTGTFLSADASVDLMRQFQRDYRAVG